MKVAILKFGGTSLQTTERVKAAAEIIRDAVAQDFKVVAVASAMGHTTDHLLSLTDGLDTHSSLRELDMLLASGEQISASLLAMALNSAGVPAVALTGAQAGIFRQCAWFCQYHARGASQHSLCFARLQGCRRNRLPGRYARWRYHDAGPRRFRHDSNCTGTFVACPPVRYLLGRARNLLRGPGSDTIGETTARRNTPTDGCAVTSGSASNVRDRRGTGGALGS